MQMENVTWGQLPKDVGSVFRAVIAEVTGAFGPIHKGLPTDT
jgi:hypothetical protein